MTDLERRMEALETSNRRLKLACVLGGVMGASIALAGAAPNGDARFHVVAADKIVVGNASRPGTVIVIDGTGAKGAGLYVERVDGGRTAPLVAIETVKDKVVLGLSDPDSKAMVGLAADGNAAGIEITSPDGKKKLTFSVGRDGASTAL